MFNELLHKKVLKIKMVSLIVIFTTLFAKLASLYIIVKSNWFSYNTIRLRLSKSRKSQRFNFYDCFNTEVKTTGLIPSDNDYKWENPSKV